jgi:predicted nucleic acid-binding protein
VVSEVIKPDPDLAALAWLDSVDESQVYLPSLVLGELREGVERLDAGRRKEALTLWLDQLGQRFHDRIVSFDGAAAHAWGRLRAQASRSGALLPVIDSQLAAIALIHDAILATRNTKDFESCGIRLFNPFEN